MCLPQELNCSSQGYAARFREGAGKVCGAISPGYAYPTWNRPGEVKRCVPNPKRIRMRRNPLEPQWPLAAHDLADCQGRGAVTSDQVNSSSPIPGHCRTGLMEM
jgi:hypothetical protein